MIPLQSTLQDSLRSVKLSREHIQNDLMFHSLLPEISSVWPSVRTEISRVNKLGGGIDKQKGEIIERNYTLFSEFPYMLW